MFLFAGIATSVLHVISGPDHLTDVTPLAIETRRKLWKIFLFWGFGHLAGMLLLHVFDVIFFRVTGTFKSILKIQKTKQTGCEIDA